MLERITPAQISWDENNLPRSEAYSDLYFSAEDGLSESQYVFLAQNQLESRWATLGEGAQFVIAETGFGSGLNLLVAAQLWKSVAPESSKLHFLSIEKHPLQLGDLARAHKSWPELAELSQSLLENYPSLTPGFHRFELLPNVDVTLIFDDVTSGLQSLCPPLEPLLWEHKPFQVDAWFLDGFAPAKNPHMWGPNLFPLINRLSGAGTTAATFTAAGDVRRSLQSWGFITEKVRGFGRKREMLKAHFDPEAELNLASLASAFKKPLDCWSMPEASAQSHSDPIAVIGAGIAGATLASALAKRGKTVHLFDSAASAADGASGIEQVALYARLSPDAGELEDFMLTAMPSSYSFYKKLLRQTGNMELGSLCGLIQLPRNEAELGKMRLIADRFSGAPDLVRLCQQQKLNELAKTEIDSAGLYFPNSGWLNGKLVCEALLNQSGIATFFNHRLQRFEQNGDDWVLDFGEKVLNYKTVVVCNASSAKKLNGLSWLPTREIRGQVSLFTPPPELQELSAVLCREIQLTPGSSKSFCTGSTYDLDSDDTQIRQEDHNKNFAKLGSMLGSKSAAEIEADRGQAGVRCATPDYLPISGPVPDAGLFLERFSPLRKDAKSQLPFTGPILKGLYLNIGFGSRGYTYSPLCAENLASLICCEPNRLPGNLAKAINPARFLVRGLKRGSL